MRFALFALVLVAFQAFAHFAVSPPASEKLALLHDIGHDSYKTGTIFLRASSVEYCCSAPGSRVAVTLNLAVFS